MASFNTSFFNQDDRVSVSRGHRSRPDRRRVSKVTRERSVSPDCESRCRPPRETSTSCCRPTPSKTPCALNKYVVNNDPCCASDPTTYKTLHNALMAANADPNSNACDGGGVVIQLTPTAIPHELTDALTTDRKITIMSPAGAVPTSTIVGCGHSLGNKSYQGVSFSDPQGLYHLGTTCDSQCKVTDTFHKCEVTCDFKFSTDDNTLLFDNCFINHLKIRRDDLMEVNGSGNIVIQYCNMVINRAGSCRSRARRFMKVCAEAGCDEDTNNSTRILHSYITSNIGSKEDYTIFSIHSNQHFVFAHSNMIFGKARPKTTIFGITNVKAKDGCDSDDKGCGKKDCCDSCCSEGEHVNQNASLSILHSAITTPDLSDVTLIGNLMSGDEFKPMVVFQSDFIGGHVYSLYIPMDIGSISSLRLHASYVACNLPGASHYELLLNDGSRVFLKAAGTLHETESSAPYFNVNPVNVGGGATLTYEYTTSTISHFGGVTPTWLFSGLDNGNVSVPYGSINLIDVSPVHLGNVILTPPTIAILS